MRSHNPWMHLRPSKLKLQNELGKKIRDVKYDCGGEYYGKYDGSGEQHPRPFAKFLEECGIISQYTTSIKPSLNGVVER